jgi:hypothetical protein
VYNVSGEGKESTMHKSGWFLLTSVVALLIGCSPEEVEVTREVFVTQGIPVTVEVTREVTVEVPQEVEGTVQIAVGQTVAAWPSPTPIPSATSTPEPTSTPESTQPVYRWRDQVDDPLGKMVKETDSLRGVSWYDHEDNPDTRQSNWIGLYIAEKEGEHTLFLFINYYGDDWLFIEKYLVGADDQVFSIETRYGDVERDHSGGRIWEWYQYPLLQSQLEMIEAVIQSEDATLRYDGDIYYSDRTITPKEKNAMRVTLAAFEELGGDLYSLPDLD